MLVMTASMCFTEEARTNATRSSDNELILHVWSGNTY